MKWSEFEDGHHWIDRELEKWSEFEDGHHWIDREMWSEFEVCFFVCLFVWFLNVLVNY